jgi:hypothetical protein
LKDNKELAGRIENEVRIALGIAVSGTSAEASEAEEVAPTRKAAAADKK